MATSVSDEEKLAYSRGNRGVGVNQGEWGGVQYSGEIWEIFGAKRIVARIE